MDARSVVRSELLGCDCAEAKQAKHWSNLSEMCPWLLGLFTVSLAVLYERLTVQISLDGETVMVKPFNFGCDQEAKQAIGQTIRDVLLDRVVIGCLSRFVLIAIVTRSSDHRGMW